MLRLCAHLNTVNIQDYSEIVTDSYHHGHLREELIAAAMLSVKTGKIDKFSLRATAQQLGVSPAAVYHHFADKAALINAVIRETGILLNQKMHAALDPEPAFGENAMVLGLSYIDFAIEEPSLFVQLTSTACPESEDIQAQSLTMVAEAIVKDSPRELSSSELQEKVWASWAIAHGFASLALAGQMSPGQARNAFRSQCHPAS
jgi:AcrR family transcriptional regulator